MSFSSVCNHYRICLQCGRPRFDPGVRKIPWRRAWIPTPLFSLGEFHGQSVVGSSWWNPQGRKESDMTERLTETVIEKLENTNKKKEGTWNLTILIYLLPDILPCTFMWINTYCLYVTLNGNIPYIGLAIKFVWIFLPFFFLRFLFIYLFDTYTPLYFIYSFLAMLGLRCHTRGSSCGERGQLSSCCA